MTGIRRKRLRVTVNFLVAPHLLPGVTVALDWNERSETATPFMAAYAEFLRAYGNDICDVTDTTQDRFFAPVGYEVRSCDNAQQFDLADLMGRFLSLSDASLPGQAVYESALAELDALFTRFLFTRFQQDGYVRFGYVTEIYYGRLRANKPENKP